MKIKPRFAGLDTPQNREIIRVLHTDLSERLATVDKATAELSSSWNGFHGGIEDDHEIHRRELEQARSFARLTGQRDTLTAIWTTVKTIYGDDAIAHALDEGNECIGALPYVKEMR